MKTTKIEWTEKVWNPSIGCNKVSAGCKFCYAESFSRRLQAMGMKDYSKGFEFKMLPHRLEEPLYIKKSTRFFVNSMSDLFHEEMPYEYLDKVFEIINHTPRHTYQILTKREKIMTKYFEKRTVPENVWLGVTVENEMNKYRIDHLRNVNARIRFLSIEPLIGDVGKLNLDGIHWVIVGGESGVKARPMNPEWVKNIQSQCKAQKVSFFFKQWGTWGADGIKRNKKANGRLFLGREWNENPIILRID